MGQGFPIRSPAQGGGTTFHATVMEAARLVGMTLPPGLTYYPDDRPGITRRKAGRGWSYRAPNGTRIACKIERRRIEALAVPPAYARVWISPKPNGHLQATGFDTRDRKQYRYHPDWTAFRARTKFEDLPRFGAALPGLRRKIAERLTADGADLAIAAVLRLMDRASMRIGTPDYAQENGTYGASTLRSRHVHLEDGEITLRYAAKGGQKVKRVLNDRLLHRALGRLDDLPGAEVMVWLDERGTQHSLTPDTVNAWLADATGEEGLTAKTFRTWNGSAAAAGVLLDTPGMSIKAISEAAADVLHNTPTIARNSYIHPAVIEAAQDADVLRAPDDPVGLRRAERALLALIS